MRQDETVEAYSVDAEILNLMHFNLNIVNISLYSPVWQITVTDDSMWDASAYKAVL